MTDSSEADFEPQVRAFAEAAIGREDQDWPSPDLTRPGSAPPRILGDGVDLLVDVNSNYTFDIARESIAGWRPIASAGEVALRHRTSRYGSQRWSPIPIATGEGPLQRLRLQALGRGRAVDVPSRSLSLRRFLAGAAHRGYDFLDHVRLSPHVWGSGIRLPRRCTMSPRWKVIRMRTTSRSRPS